jgi:hypothetical protein
VSIPDSVDGSSSSGVSWYSRNSSCKVDNLRKSQGKVQNSSWNLQLYFFFFDVEEGVLGPEFHLLFVDSDIVIKCQKQILFKAKLRMYISNWCCYPFDYVNNNQFRIPERKV